MNQETLDLKKTAGQIVDNAPRVGDTTYHGIDPSTGTPLWDVPVARQNDVDDAVAAANGAFKKWSSLPQQERSRLMKDLAACLEKHKDALTDVLHKESGKPVKLTHSARITVLIFFSFLFRSPPLTAYVTEAVCGVGNHDGYQHHETPW